MPEKILIVDDEARVLQGIKRGMHGVYDIVTATGGEEGLDVLERDDEIAVVVSDMRMPKMDGATFLKTVRARFPSRVRLMLTGNNDIGTAKKAVNEGAVFRFLNKPCSREGLGEAIDAALEQYRLQKAEREVLEQTLAGSVSAMASLLALSRPSQFGAVDRVVDLCQRIAASFPQTEAWIVHAAATLSTIGYVSADPALIEKRQNGASLTEEELSELAEHAAAGADLLAQIPRMQPVADIIRNQHRNVASGELPHAALILRVAHDFTALQRSGWSVRAAMDKLKNAPDVYDGKVVAVLEELLAAETQTTLTKRVPVGELAYGMIIQEDIYTVDEVLIVCEGQIINAAVARHLQKLGDRGVLKDDPLITEKLGQPIEDTLDS